MKKKSDIEADLDPRGTRQTRPGSKIADAAMALTKPPGARKRRSGASASRPGATAAARAVAATKRKRKPRGGA